MVAGPAMQARRAALERVYVWELPVRITHWVNVLAIFTLCATGFYIGDPFFGGTVFLMGTVRFIHLVTAYVLVAGVAARIYWAFMGNRWSSWRVFFPYLTAAGWRDLKHTFLYYTFIRRKPPGDIGHNGLAGLAYSAVYFLLIVQIVTGFALYSVVADGWSRAMFGWVFLILSPPAARLTHHMIMWLLLGFVIHHVYSALLMDTEERNGIMTSIFSGYKFVRPPR
jgi:Ni/Fe-hydrogenase 1 B-type cytochrome subunit